MTKSRSPKGWTLVGTVPWSRSSWSIPSPGPYLNRKGNYHRPTNPHIPDSSFRTASFPIPSCRPAPLSQLFWDCSGTRKLLCLADICRQYPAGILLRGTTARLPLPSWISHVLLCIVPRRGSSPPAPTHASPQHLPYGSGANDPSAPHRTSNLSWFLQG